jgi:hypothetical protein
MKINYLILGFLFLAFGFSSCNDKDDDSSDDFDRKTLLKNYANNIITPAYKNSLDLSNELKDAITSFNNNSTEATLSTAKQKWKNAYKAWQYSSSFNFGPAAEEGLNKSLNEEIATFPVNEVKIENAVESQVVNDFNRDARGFLAIEYLLFNSDENTTLVEFENQKRKTYLNLLIGQITDRISTVYNQWNGTYSTSFVENTGTDAGSSVSLLYNEFVKDFEALKNFKVELPLGKRPGQTSAEPELVEAFYSGESLTMIGEKLNSINNFYQGINSSGFEGVGFTTYLENVEGGEALIEATTKQWNNVMVAYNNIPKNISMSQQIENSPVLIEAFQIELQKQIRFFKSDMSSVLGIAITYASGDGD